MKNFLLILTITTSLFYSCNKNETKIDQSENQNKKDSTKNESPKEEVKIEKREEQSDSITNTVEKLRGYLANSLIKDDIKYIDAENRVFRYDSCDLNFDGKLEYLITIENSYFCGSGGCNVWLISNQGKLITKFTVSDVPFIVVPMELNGWNNLLIPSGNSLHEMVSNGKKYPGNPSVQPLFNEEPEKDWKRLLGEDCKEFTF